MAEYEACITGMDALWELRVKEAEVFGDSTLVIAQAKSFGSWRRNTWRLINNTWRTWTFDKIEYTIIPRAQNQFADALATLASMVEIPEEVWTRSLEIEQSYEEVHKGKTEASVMNIEEEEVMWYYDIMKFLELKEYPDGNTIYPMGRTTL